MPQHCYISSSFHSRELSPGFKCKISDKFCDNKANEHWRKTGSFLMWCDVTWRDLLWITIGVTWPLSCQDISNSVLMLVDVWLQQRWGEVSHWGWMLETNKNHCIAQIILYSKNWLKQSMSKRSALANLKITIYFTTLGITYVVIQLTAMYSPLAWKGT